MTTGLAVVVSHGAALRLGMSRLLGMPGGTVRRARPAVELLLVGPRPPARPLAASRAQRRHPARARRAQRRTVNDISTERARRSVSLTWYGQAGFRLAAGSSRVLIDPFLTDRDDRNYRPPARAADFADVTLVLCTHEHVGPPGPAVPARVLRGQLRRQDRGAAARGRDRGRGRDRPRPAGRRGAGGGAARPGRDRAPGAGPARDRRRRSPWCTSSPGTAARSGSSATCWRSAASASTTPVTAWSIPSSPPPCRRSPPTC